ncbi:MAG: glycoside hydrolase family 1 protein [Actinobacteria bacterium]|nr:glycoside hydrolase family 1 protein [Actinomycetota bacterium]
MQALPSNGAPRPSIRQDFLFGVGDSGFQSEGGYNGPGEPQNNWADWEASGRATPSGIANEFWTRYPEHFDRALEAGCNGFRMGVEWTRCEPSAGAIDIGALTHYSRILRVCCERGLEPVAALHHFTHPAWLGADFWLDDDAPARFAHWVDSIVPWLAPHCSRWITINEINAYAIGTYLIGYFPPGHRLRRRLAAKAMSNMLAGHVLAYEVIHRHQPDAMVGTSTYAFWSYDADRLPIDLLLSRSAGVRRGDVHDWLSDRRIAYHRAVLEGVSPMGRLVESAIHHGVQSFLHRNRAWAGALDAVFTSTCERPLDVVQLNYYDPRLSNYLRMPGRDRCGARRWGPDPKHWEQRPSPEHLLAYLRANDDPRLPIWILESGLCNPVTGGVAHERPDGWTRPRYLREHLGVLQQALDAGIDIRAYFHWSLFDSYQWGEYESCFGLHGVKREGGTCKFLETDSMGANSGAAYGQLIATLRHAG